MHRQTSYRNQENYPVPINRRAPVNSSVFCNPTAANVELKSSRQPRSFAKNVQPAETAAAEHCAMLVRFILGMCCPGAPGSDTLRAGSAGASAGAGGGGAGAGAGAGTGAERAGGLIPSLEARARPLRPAEWRLFFCHRDLTRTAPAPAPAPALALAPPEWRLAFPVIKSCTLKCMTLSRSSSASIMSKLVVPTDDRLGSSFAIAGGARFVLDERIISALADAPFRGTSLARHLHAPVGAL